MAPFGAGFLNLKVFSFCSSFGGFLSSFSTFFAVLILSL